MYLYGAGNALGPSIVNDHVDKSRLPLTQPGQIRCLPPEQIGDRIHQDDIGRPDLEATHIYEREDAVHRHNQGQGDI